MTIYRTSGAIMAVVAACALANSPAAAAKKMSYDAAWAQCKAQVDRTVPGDQASARHSAGAACMKKNGYRLKKGSV